MAFENSQMNLLISFVCLLLVSGKSYETYLLRGNVCFGNLLVAGSKLKVQKQHIDYVCRYYMPVSEGGCMHRWTLSFGPSVCPSLCLSVCLSVQCLTLSRERKGIGR